MDPKTITTCSLLLLVLALQMNLVCSTSRPLTANQPVISQQPSQSVLEVESGTHLSSNQGIGEEAYNSKGFGKIGSSPPNCEHKCYGCSPCEAIEVPTTSRSHSHGLRLSYANYEPESWKCKCGPSFYSP
ncbi:unnamed protein product [Linum trigynum]|uniref:Epidermal patterning factor-like protein n=1 Tax=Linum trigynum TaxID=586398 RepID=A0AAV2FQN0_9ROSI